MSLRSASLLGLILSAMLAASSLSMGPADAQNRAADIERGRHVATALAGCADCHGATFGGGREFKRGDQIIFAANLTGGTGGIAAYNDADVRRAIRNGIRPDGSVLRVMPSREYAVLTDNDVDDVVSFLRSLPPINSTLAPSPPPERPAAASLEPAPVALRSANATLSLGAYLTTIGGCTNCHGATLSGRVAGNGPATPNISHDGIGDWSFADFVTAMRAGRTPNGRTLSKSMPWETVGTMTDAELRAVYDFLQAQPPRAN